MKKYYIGKYTIVKLNDILRKQYNSKYLITINGDIVDFAETLKQAKHNSRNNFWKSEYKFNRIYI